MTKYQDKLVRTKDGRQHRVLWPTKFDQQKNPTHFRVKAHDRKGRGSYEIRVEDIEDGQS